MARVRDVGIDEVPEDAKPVYQRFADEYGPFLNQAKIFAHRPIALLLLVFNHAPHQENDEFAIIL